MSGGRKINDHSSWMGAKGKDTVFPSGPYKTKDESSAEGAGEILQYEDTTEAIKREQQMGNKKIKSHPMKAGYRY